MEIKEKAVHIQSQIPTKKYNPIIVRPPQHLYNVFEVIIKVAHLYLPGLKSDHFKWHKINQSHFPLKSIKPMSFHNIYLGC